MKLGVNWHNRFRNNYLGLKYFVCELTFTISIVNINHLKILIRLVEIIFGCNIKCIKFNYSNMPSVINMGIVLSNFKSSVVGQCFLRALISYLAKSKSHQWLAKRLHDQTSWLSSSVSYLHECIYTCMWYVNQLAKLWKLSERP